MVSDKRAPRVDSGALVVDVRGQHQLLRRIWLLSSLRRPLGFRPVLRTSRPTRHTRLFGPGNSDQSRPSSSQTRRTTRGSRVWREPPRGTSAFRPSWWTVTMTGPSCRFSCPWSKRHPRSA